MDIIIDFGSIVGGSSPSGCTRILKSSYLIYNIENCGYGLVVECVLAKDETGVRFSLPAPQKVFLI